MSYNIIDGPGTWRSIHSMALSCETNEDVRIFDKFIRSIARKLRCEKCAIHFLQYIDSHPIIGLSPGEIFIWTITAHNSVNSRLGKPTYNIEDARRLYNDVSYQNILVTPNTRNNIPFNSNISNTNMLNSNILNSNTFNSNTSNINMLNSNTKTLNTNIPNNIPNTNTLNNTISNQICKTCTRKRQNKKN